MKQFYTFSLLYLLLVACTNQIVSSSDGRPNKRQRLTLDQDVHTNTSSSKPRYHTRSVTRRHAEKLAQRDKKLAGQLAFYKKLEKKQDASATYKDLIQTFNYLDLPVDLQREVSEWYNVDQPCTVMTNFTNPYEKLPRPYSPLQYAIHNHNSDQVQILLALHAHINGTHADSFYTPLYLAIDEYYHSLDEYFYYPLDENYHRIDGGYSPIIASYAIFKHLLKKGVDCNKPNLANQKYALFSTAKKIETIPLFLDLINEPNINLHVTNRKDQTALDLIKYNAMCPYYTVDERKGCYRICALLEKKGVASSVVLKPMPTDAVMRQDRCSHARCSHATRMV